MDKIRIGNLTHTKYYCNCGKTATIYIFILTESKTRNTIYKCTDCMDIINKVIKILDLTIKN